MIIKHFETGPLATVGYLVVDEGTGYAVMIDAPKDISIEVMRMVNENDWEVLCLINTHGHWDHIADNSEIVSRTAAKIAIHEKDAPLLENPKMFMFDLPFKIEGIKPDILLNDGDIIEVGNLRFKVLHTPGHTPGGICLYMEKEKVLFSGDTLFSGTIGRTDLPGGSFEQLVNSIQEKLFKLNDSVIVYPGHGPSTSIGREKKCNPFLQEIILNKIENGDEN